MNRLFARIVAVACGLAAWAFPAAAQRWQMQYFYDEAKSELAIQDMAFSSPTRGVAVGRIEERGGRERGVSLATSDGGAHWKVSPLDDKPLSLFLLNDSVGWMVTEKGLWRTSEGGKDWVKLPKVPAPALRVYFVDEKRGWAACGNKTVLATVDGGAHWAKVEEASKQPGTTAGTVYGWIAFATPEIGIITGWDLPLRRDRLPDWLDPERVVTRRETPHLTLTMETRDGGKTWRSTSASAFGEVTRVHFGAPGAGLGIVTHSSSFPYPSEVYRILWPSGKSELTYRDSAFCATDAWLEPDGTAYIAGAVVFSRLRDYVPQKVKVLKSVDFKNWTPVPVDYRAVAKRATLAGAGGELWLATDNGMILKLTP